MEIPTLLWGLGILCKCIQPTTLMLLDACWWWARFAFQYCLKYRVDHVRRILRCMISHWALVSTFHRSKLQSMYYVSFKLPCLRMLLISKFTIENLNHTCFTVDSFKSFFTCATVGIDTVRTNSSVETRIRLAIINICKILESLHQICHNWGLFKFRL